MKSRRFLLSGVAGYVGLEKFLPPPHTPGGKNVGYATVSAQPAVSKLRRRFLLMIQVTSSLVVTSDKINACSVYTQ